MAPGFSTTGGYRFFRYLMFACSLAVSFVQNGGIGRAETTMGQATQSRIATYLAKAVQVCWVMPADTTRVARIAISLNKDGSLAGPPKILSPPTQPPDKFAEAAVRAIMRCAPFPGLATYATYYDLWRDVVLTFDPTDFSPGRLPKAGANGVEELLEKYGKKAK